MLKFSMNTKELNAMLEKGLAVINKKTYYSALQKLIIRVDESGIVRVLGTDLDQFLELRNENTWDTEPGSIAIDYADVKVISKMTDDVTIEDISTELEPKISIRNGKKIVSIKNYDDNDNHLPVLEDEEHILTVSESWLLETISNLSVFTFNNKTNKILQAFNFNVVNSRVEALDEHKVGIRTIENQHICKENSNTFDNILLMNSCVPIFKKLLNKKSDSNIKMYQDRKYVHVEGNDFTYISKRLDGQYPNINNLLFDFNEYSFVPDRQNILSIMKYNCDLQKRNKPVVVYGKAGKLYSYMKTEKYETFDEIETEDINMPDGLFIGLNPYYLVDVFTIVDSDRPVCRCTNGKAPMYIDGNEYHFILLPVIFSPEIKDNIRKLIDSEKTA